MRFLGTLLGVLLILIGLTHLYATVLQTVMNDYYTLTHKQCFNLVVLFLLIKIMIIPTKFTYKDEWMKENVGAIQVIAWIIFLIIFYVI